LGKDLAKSADDPQVSAAARRFNHWSKTSPLTAWNRREVFERLGSLERELAESSELDREAQDEGLKELARELEKSGLTKLRLAEALSEKRLADAEQALRELAERLKKKQSPPSKAELDKLRSALQKASLATSEHQAGIDQRRKELDEEEESLLKKKQQGDNSPKMRKSRQKIRRKLERLERDKQRSNKRPAAVVRARQAAARRPRAS